MKQQTGAARTVGWRGICVEWLPDCLAVLLLAAGVSMALYTAVIPEGRFGICLGMAALALGLVLLARLRWWVAPALVAGGALALLGLSNLGEGTGGREVVGTLGVEAAALFRWALAGMPFHPVLSGGAVQGVLRFLLSLALTIGIFLLVRKFFWFPGALLLWAGFFITFYAMGYRSFEGLAVSAAGLVILLPRLYHGHMVRSSPDSAKISRGAMQLIAVPIAIAAVGLSAWMARDTETWRSAGLVNLVNDLSYLVRSPFVQSGGGRSNFTLGQTGYLPLESRLGGPVSLEEGEVLTVETEIPLLLRGSVEDFYTGSSWRDSRFDGEYRFSSLFWRRYRSDAFDYAMPAGGREAGRIYNEITAEVEYKMTYRTSRYTSVFSAGRVREVFFANSMGDLQVYFDGQSELYLHYRMPARQHAQVRTQVFLRNSPDFEEKMLRLEQLAARGRDSRYGEIQERYTQLPEDLPEAVREAAQEAAGEGETPYEMARNLERWLAEHCDYTLEPVEPPEGEDFVAHFLETGEGYCTYYATAMAVMARNLDLPARYVTGFGMRSGEREGEYAASGDTAHAWVEIYFRGIGWVEFDPLQWDFQVPASAAEEPSIPVLPVPPLREEPETDQGEEEIEIWEADGDPGSPGDRSFLLPLAGCALALLGLLGLHRLTRWIWRLPRKRYEPGYMARWYGSREERMDRYYADLLRQLSLLGVEPEPGETLVSFARRADRQISPAGEGMAGAARIRMAQHYGGTPPSLEDLEQVWSLHAALEKQLEERMSRVSYFLRRALAVLRIG